jgi:GAF domain-containing protein
MAGKHSDDHRDAPVAAAGDAGANDAVVPGLRLTEVARLVEGDEDRGRVLQRIVAHAVSLVPGCVSAGLTVTGGDGGWDVAVTDERVARCHDAQFRTGGTGPARDVLRYGEPRRVDDAAAEDRWPGFAAVAREGGFASCLALPLGAEPGAASALNLYAAEPAVFVGRTFDVALLFAAQGEVALSNADLYRQARQLVEHLHRTLVTRSVIERAKGVLMGREGLGEEQAFQLLRSRSQSEHRKLHNVAADLLGHSDPEGPVEDVAWTPPRGPSPSRRQ